MSFHRYYKIRYDYSMSPTNHQVTYKRGHLRWNVTGPKSTNVRQSSIPSIIVPAVETWRLKLTQEAIPFLPVIVKLSATFIEDLGNPTVN